MVPRTCSCLDWISPSRAGALRPTSMPMLTSRAPNPATSKAAAMAAGCPEASMTTSAPRPPVSSMTCSTNPSAVGSTTSSAPSERAISQRPWLGSAQTTRPPRVAATATAPSPIGPAPKTTTVSLASMPSARVAA